MNAIADPADPVITGIGVAAPNGLGLADFWSATVQGRGGIGPITRFDASSYPARLAGEIPGFVASEHVPGRLLTQTDHMTRLALTAAAWALEDAGLVPTSSPTAGPGGRPGPFDIGVVTANSFGGFEFGHRELDNLWRKGVGHVGAYQSFAWFYAVNTGQISIRHDLRGPGGVIVTEQAGGLDALATARRQIRAGTPAVVTGGTDGALCPWGWTAMLTSGRISTATDPERAYLPFDAAARGHVPGEGGAILILEDAAAARARSARSYGVLAGYGATFDPAPDTGRPPALARAIRLALADARLAPDQVDLVIADAAGTPKLDHAEAGALREVFGPRGVPVSAPKTMVGRLAAGGAALDVVTALLAIRDGIVPPTTNVTAPADGLDLDLVLSVARPASLHNVLVVARGHGGFNAAVVVREADQGAPTSRTPAPQRRHP